MNTCQEIEICIQKLSTDLFHHLFSKLQSKSHLIVNDLYRMFFEKSKSMSLQQHQLRSCSSRNSKNAISKTVISNLISYKFTLRHISTRRSHLFSKRSNSKSSKSTHARENLSRKFSISIHVSRFSKISHFISICKRCQKHFVIYLLNSWLASIASRIESSEIFMRISILKKYWFEKVTKIVCFSNFSFVEEILDRVYLLFQLSSFALFSFRKDVMIWESLTCCCFSCLLILVTLLYLVLRWENHCSEEN